METTACFVCAPLNVQATFELFCGIEKQSTLFQVALGGCVGSTIDHPASGLRSFENVFQKLLP